MNEFQKAQLKSLLLDVDVYCASTRNAVIINKVSVKDFFPSEIKRWQNDAHRRKKAHDAAASVFVVNDFAAHVLLAAALCAGCA